MQDSPANRLLTAHDTLPRAVGFDRTGKLLDKVRDQAEPGECGMRRVEIEQRLTRHPEFAGAAVVVCQFSEIDDSRVVGFYKSTRPLSSQALHDVAVEVLPAGMVPDVFIQVNDFFLTEEGELDTERLIELLASDVRQSSDKSVVPPRGLSETEESIRECFAELFDVEAASIALDDDFFDLGGSSFDCVVLFNWIEEHRGVDLPLSTITSSPTVRLLAAIVDRHLNSGAPRFASSKPPAEQWEWMLCILWSEILGVDGVRPQDDFFKLGGSVADGQRMAERLGAMCGIDVSLAEVKRAPTVIQLAALIRGRSTGSCLVPLNATGTNTPFFCIAGLGGLALAFLPLSRELGADQPFYGLQAHGIDRRGLPDYTIKRTVARYVQAIRSVQPHGPYLIGGHSYGGLHALEVAHQLTAEDEEVALLAVFDTVLPERLTDSKRPESTDSTVRSSPIRWLDRQALITLANYLRLPAAGLVRQHGEAQTEAFRLIGRVQTRLAKPLRPWPGLAAVFISDEQLNQDYVQSTWGRLLTGSWSSVLAPGDHLTMMQRPHAAQLADNLKAILARVSSLNVTAPTDGECHNT